MILDKENRVTRQQFLTQVAKKNGVTVESLTNAYNMLFDGIFDIVKENKSLCLTGFGVFYLQKHKGHKMQFGVACDGNDYYCFKFSSANTLNQRLRQDKTEATDVKSE